MGKVLRVLVLAICGQADLPDGDSLVVWPENIGRYVREHVGCESRSLGYTQEEMAHFSGYPYRLGFVSRLFEDAEGLPTATNAFARRMLDGGYDSAVQSALAILGGKATKLSDSEQATLAITPVDDASQEVWESLPQEVHRGVEELVRGATRARRQLHLAFDWDLLAQQVGDPNVSLSTNRAYQYAVAPWSGASSAASFAALSSFHATPLRDASLVFFSSVRSATAHLCSMDKTTEVPKFVFCRLKTPVGTVCILGRGNNTYRGSDAIVIDLGGSDQYSGRLAAPLSKAAPIGLLIDMAGNDTYDGRECPGSLACGLFGIGALFDLGGHDKYYCEESGLGCAWHGVGLLLDTVGDDLYSGNRWCQGAAHAGAGFLIDESGDDRYFCQLESQGLGATLGVGVLMDRSGDDRYHAYDDENGRSITFPSSQTKSHEVSMVQGCGYGRRADASDGRSLAGGVGALIDGDGDDTYYGGVFSQATAFWWSLGMLVDFGGNDHYRGVYFAQGASAHFALGSLVDHAGNDSYNDQRVLGQVLGAGRDASIGAFVDVMGDDEYFIPKKSAGGGDINSIGLFCDKRGNDVYHPLSHSYMGTASFGGSAQEPFRRQIPTIGIFVDLDGEDTYPSHVSQKNYSRWHHQNSPFMWGFGFDTRRKSPEE